MWKASKSSCIAVVLVLYLQLDSFSTGFVSPWTAASRKTSPPTELHFFFGRGKNKEQGSSNADGTDSTSAASNGNASPTIRITNTQADDYVSSSEHVRRGPMETADIVIIGGGVSGLAAAITAAQANKNAKIVLLEANSKLGGRVQSVETEDGFVLDEGFAVFIDQYPEVQKLLDFDALKLKSFLPGALVKLKDRSTLARVADPLKNPADLVPSALAPVGSLLDKIEVLPLVFNVRYKSIEELFEERETDTLTVLQDRYGFSEDFIGKFLKPFLEGIYLAPLDQQSSRMFSFVFKMFSEGSATLPAGGMKAIAEQLVDKARSLGVEVRTDTPATCISTKDGDESSFLVECAKTKKRFKASSLIVATDGKIAQKLISNVQGFESLEDLPEQPQLSVGCLYYSFKGTPPVEDPILILSGIGAASGNEKNPSLVGKLTISSKSITSQIPKAQPGQYKGPFPASVNGGRPNNQYRGKDLPTGLLVCGDHMSTATLNGAVESGVSAGKDAAKTAKAAIAARNKAAAA
ncbi:MAG: hypothetical protein SGILL_000454 [Bacillariaceae sp.]